MRNRYFERAKSVLRRLIQREKDPQKRDDLKNILEDIQDGIAADERVIFAAKMIGYRNPSFDGDEIGYPDDDFK